MRGLTLSIRELVDASGTLQTRYDYDMWGKRTLSSGTINSAVGYTGHHHHARSDLILTWYRAYDAEVGRWLSPDPIQEAGGVNLYGYVGRDPVNGVDPLGLVDSVETGMAGSIAQGDVEGLKLILQGLEGPQAQACQSAITRLTTPVQNLIRGTLKRSKSYAGELGEKTLKEIIELSKGRGEEATKELIQKAKQMLKLVKDEQRLMEKCGSK